jgi:hypothetical protein
MKKIILFVTLMILLAVSVNGAITDNVFFHFSMNSTATGTQDTSGNNNNLLTKAGNPTIATGKLNYSVDFDGTDDDYLNASASGYPELSRSMCLWYYADGEDDRGDVLYDNTLWSERSTKDGWVIARDFESDTMNFQVADTSNDKVTLAYSAKLTEWAYICAVWDSSTHNLTVYINGTYETSGVNALVGNIATNTVNFVLGDYYAGTRNWNGKIDEVTLYSRALNSSEPAILFNKSGNPYYTPPPTAPVITLISPTANDHNSNPNVSFTFNVYDNNFTGINCSIYINASLNQTTNGISNNTNVTFNVTLSGGDGEYVWLINCTDGIDASTESRSYFLDTVNPDVTWNFPVQANTSTVYENFNVNITVFDKYLFRVNMSVFAPNNSVFYNNYSGNINQEWYNMTDSITMTNRPRGTYTIETSATDDHTYGELKHLNKRVLTDNILSFYDTEREMTVTFDIYSKAGYKKNSNVKSTVEDVKIKDKLKKEKISMPVFENYLTEYKFNYDFTVPEKGDYVIVTLELDTGDFLARDSGLAAHFLYGDKYYIDFEDAKTIFINSNPIEAIVEVVHHSGNLVKVKINPFGGFSKGDIVYIDPVTGGLNINTENVTFLYNAPPVTNNASILPDIALSGDNLITYCNVTDSNNDRLTYEYRIYRNSTLFSSGIVFQNNSGLRVQQPTNNGTLGANGTDGNFSTFTNLTGWWSYSIPVNRTMAYWYFKYNDSFDNVVFKNLSLQNCMALNKGILNFTFSTAVGGFNTMLCNNVEIHRFSQCIGVSCDTNTFYGDNVYFYNGLTGGNRNVVNVSYLNTSVGDNFSIGCRAHDAFNYSNWTNSSIRTITDFAIDNCSTFTTVGMNISVYDADSLALLNSSISGFFTVWFNDKSQGINSYNFSWPIDESHTICISPASKTLSFDSQIEYSTVGYPTQTYYHTSAPINNVTENLSLYLTQNTTVVTFTVTDENDNPVEGLFIRILKYNLVTNSSILTEIIETDSSGQSLGNIVLNTQRYKFVLVYNGNTVLETSDTILTLTSYSFRVNLGTDFFETYDDVLDIPCYVDFSNSTKLFTFFYNDPSGTTSQGCLRVVRKSAFGDLILSDSCVVSAASTLTYNVTATPGNFTYVGTGYFVFNGNEYLCDSASFSYDTRYLAYGESGLFSTFLIVLTLAAVGIWSPPIAIFLTVVGFVLANMLNIFHMSWIWLLSFIIIGGIALVRSGRK